MGISRDVSILESGFPQLKNSQYQITSGPDAAYNCIAWVFRDTKNWWELGRYWPSETELGDTVSSITRFFEAFNFTYCDRGDLEQASKKFLFTLIATAISPMWRYRSRTAHGAVSSERAMTLSTRP